MSRLRRKIKHYSRKALDLGGKVSKVARPLVSAAAGYFAGPAGVLAVNAISHYGQQYQVASGARGEGIRGREARQLGREAAQRTTMHSLIAGGVGSLASGVTSAFAGGSFLGGAAAGQGGSALLGGTTIFGGVGTPATLGTVAGGTLTGGSAIAGAQSIYSNALDPVKPGETGGGTAIPGASTWADLLETVAGGLAGGGGGGSDEPRKPGESRQGDSTYSNVNSPTGEDGGSSKALPWLIAAGVGLALLA